MAIGDFEELTLGAGLTGTLVSATHLEIEATAGAGTEIAYVQFTSSVSVTATAEASPNDVVSAGAITFDGSTPVLIEFYAYSIAPGASGGSYVVLNLWDGSTDLGRLGAVGAPGLEIPVRLPAKLTPSSGSHTYKVRAWRVTSNGTVSAGAGGAGTARPGFIRITNAS